MKRDRLADLREVADLILDAELARLRSEAGARGKLMGRIDELDLAVARQQEILASEIDPEVSGAVCDRWGGWAERRKVALNTALAAQTAKTEVQADRTRLAFGRVEALRLLAEAAARKRNK
jgi:hypothetical protein